MILPRNADGRLNSNHLRPDLHDDYRGITMMAALPGGGRMIDAYGAPYAALVLRVALAALFFAHGWLFTNKDGGWEYPAFWAAMLAVLALLGDGAYALVPSPWL